ncbi:MAG: AmmeMemoRadiSam system protein B [Abditibacteriales bacterium]|nr:AmmeMemoRadiSam system protein B [Abditibacteriales bacterium]MDW8366140.1 AmmeMemoRadiSam system protein B [Abditibacteriales bacterium]
MAHERHHRPALVAGLFYEDNPAELEKSIAASCLHPLGAGHLPVVAADGARVIVGLVCPHAGYLYSGPPATRSYVRLAEDGVPEVAVIVAPAHYRPVGDCAVWAEGVWETPLGEVPVDAELAAALVERHPLIQVSELPHLGLPSHPEHAIEVQLPFLQFCYRDRTPRIVPMAVSAYDFGTLQTIGAVIGDALKDRNAVVIASCDLTHYQPHEVAKQQDMVALRCIADLDAAGLMTCIRRYESLSDAIAAVVMLAACQIMGATRGEILGHSTSGDITRDRAHVVGYGAAAVLKV